MWLRLSSLRLCLSSLGLLLGVSYIPRRPPSGHMSLGGGPGPNPGGLISRSLISSHLQSLFLRMGSPVQVLGLGRGHILWGAPCTPPQRAWVHPPTIRGSAVCRCGDSEECLRPWGFGSAGVGGGIGICGLPPMGLPAQPGEKGALPRLRAAPAPGVLSAAVAGLPRAGCAGFSTRRRACEQVTPTGQRGRRVSRKLPACLSVLRTNDINLKSSEFTKCL